MKTEDSIAKKDRATYGIRAVDRVCDVLDALHDHPTGISLSDLAEIVDLPKSSVLRYLSALEQRHYVARTGDDTMFTLGVAFRPDRSRDLELLRELAMPHLVRLRDRFGETANLGVIDGTDVIHVAVVESEQHVRLAARRGDHAQIHATAIGKAALSGYPSERIRQILQVTGMPAVTPRTLVTPDDFIAAARECAERGYAIDDLENQPDGRCVAVPIPGTSIAGAVSISAPEGRLPQARIPEVAKHLKNAAELIAQEARTLSI